MLRKTIYKLVSKHLPLRISMNQPVTIIKDSFDDNKVIGLDSLRCHCWEWKLITVLVDGEDDMDCSIQLRSKSEQHEE